MKKIKQKLSENKDYIDKMWKFYGLDLIDKNKNSIDNDMKLE